MRYFSWFLRAGIRLRRGYAPRRKNMHPVMLKENNAFKKLVAKDEAKAAAAAEGAVAVVVPDEEKKDEGQR
jgi:hypothetical protein